MLIIIIVIITMAMIKPFSVAVNSPTPLENYPKLGAYGMWCVSAIRARAIWNASNGALLLTAALPRCPYSGHGCSGKSLAERDHALK
jgi:hypothetical protein